MPTIIYGNWKPILGGPAPLRPTYPRPSPPEIIYKPVPTTTVDFAPIIEPARPISTISSFVKPEPVYVRPTPGPIYVKPFETSFGSEVVSGVPATVTTRPPTR